MAITAEKEYLAAFVPLGSLVSCSARIAEIQNWRIGIPSADARQRKSHETTKM
jgi:hypothetical protein